MDRIVFGLDGGGSSSRLRLADGRNRAIWEGRGEGINPVATPIALVGDRLESLFAASWAATRLKPTDIAAGCLGVAGVDRPGERAEIEGLMRARLGFACPLHLTSDPEIALVGGLKRLEGYLLIAGTGSIAIARLEDGTRLRAGGMGQYLSDEGSAFHVGFEAIRRSLRSMEGRDLPTSMMAPLLERFALPDPGQFVPYVLRRFDKAAIAGAAELVEARRAAGDPLAVAIMDRARDELVELFSSVRRQAGSRIREQALVLWGGFFEHNAWLRAGVTRSLGEACPELAVTGPLESAAWGACLLALRMTGADGPGPIIAGSSASAP